MTIEFPSNWYSDASAYWSKIDATVDGMLGGLSKVHDADARQSRHFLGQLYAQKHYLHKKHCGAGIGRVSKSVLLECFSSTDMVEFHQPFLDTAQKDPALAGGKVERFVCTGLEHFEPELGRYDVIWVQWVISHLSDDDLVAFVQRCLHALEPRDGVLVLKENVMRFGEYQVDHEDSSVTRSEPVFLRLFEQAGAQLVASDTQHGFPDELFPVKFFALKKARVGRE